MGERFVSPAPASSGRPVALVFGAGVTALGTIRSLRRAGIPAFVATATDALVRRSRAFRPFSRTYAPEEGDDRLAARLASEAPRPAVLFPCSDHWLARLAAVAGRLPSGVTAVAASPKVVDALVDKADFAAAATAHDVPHPRTLVLDSPGQLETLGEEAFDDAFLKPRDSQRFFATFGVKAFRVSGRADAIRLAAAAHERGLQMILQEYVPGPAANHYFVDGYLDDTGRHSATFVRRRLRMYPELFGNSCYMVSVRPEEAGRAEADVVSLLSAMRYRGIFSAEFKRDDRDGSFRILEVNARPWWYIEFATRCGVNTCAAACADAVGATPAGAFTGARDYAVGRTCLYPYYDFYACRALRRSGQVSLPACVASWLSSSQPVFSWSDPLPALGELVGLAKRRLRRRR